MICLEENLINKYPGIVEVMKFFIDSQRYNLVDRMAFALSPESIEQAIYDALRIVKSLESTKVYAKIKSGDKEYILNCCDYGEGQGPGINGIFLEASNKALEGKTGYCVPCPAKYPSQDELQSFLNSVRSDLSLARRISILAHGWKSRGEK